MILSEPEARGPEEHELDYQMSHKDWHSRGYLPHFDSAETVQFVTFRLGDSLPRAVAEALAALPDNLAETDHKLDNGLGACWLREPTIAQLVEDAIMHLTVTGIDCSHGMSCLTMCMWLLSQPRDIALAPSSEAGSPLPPIKQIEYWTAAGRSGIATTSTDSFETRDTSFAQSIMLRTIQ